MDAILSIFMSVMTIVGLVVFVRWVIKRKK